MALMPRTFMRALLPAGRDPPGPGSMIKAGTPGRTASAVDLAPPRCGRGPFCRRGPDTPGRIGRSRGRRPDHGRATHLDVPERAPMSHGTRRRSRLGDLGIRTRLGLAFGAI